MVAKFKKIGKARPRKNIFFPILLGVVLLLVIGFFVVTNIRISQRRAKLTARIESLKKEIQILEEKKTQLQEKISQAGSKEYLEKVAREQLGLKAPGEEVVVVTKEQEKEKETAEEKSFWSPQGWWEWLKSKVRE